MTHAAGAPSSVTLVSPAVTMNSPGAPPSLEPVATVADPVSPPASPVLNVMLPEKPAVMSADATDTAFPDNALSPPIMDSAPPSEVVDVPA